MIQPLKSITLWYLVSGQTTRKVDEVQEKGLDEVHNEIQKILMEEGYEIGPRFKPTLPNGVYLGDAPDGTEGVYLCDSSDIPDDPYYGAHILEKTINIEKAVDICKKISEIPNIQVTDMSFGVTTNDYNWEDYDTLGIMIEVR